MKNVMLIISSLAGGGAERVTVNLANALSEDYKVCIVTLFSNPDDYHPDEKVEVIRYTDYLNGLSKAARKIIQLGGYFSRLLWVSRLKRSFRPDATISMLIVPNVINAFTDCGDFRILSERADPSVIGGRYEKYIRISLPRADHTVFQSRRVQAMFPLEVQQKSSIILNPVSVSAEKQAQSEHRIVNVGRLSEQKNQRMLIKAFSRFCTEHDGYTLDIYGDGPLRQELEGLTEQLGIADRVVIHDFTPDLHTQIRSAEMFVLSSDFEGLSNALLEAMMMGIPCISTDCAGSDEVIENMKNGILVPVGNEDALLEAMNRLADDEELRRSLSENGGKASERFRADTVIKEWKDLIERNTQR